jgi:hypothetical protein
MVEIHLYRWYNKDARCFQSSAVVTFELAMKFSHQVQVQSESGRRGGGQQKVLLHLKCLKGK